MTHYIRRFVSQLTQSGALTHMLPYETRVSARRAARHS
jgi:hypothetical protein